MKIIILIFILILFYLINYFLIKKYEKYENYENKYKKDVKIIISRYNENLDYLKNDIFNNFSVIIYNKGDPIEDEYIKNNYEIININNVGRIDHTILYHIINNYSNLNEINVFIPASFYNMNNKKDIVDNIINKINNDENTKDIFNGHHTDKPIINILYDFTLDEWKASFGENNTKNPETILKKSEIRPFGKWYEKIFGNKDHRFISYNAIFSVSKDKILENSLDKYKELISYLDNHSNPEAGHYMERSWATLFNYQ